MMAGMTVRGDCWWIQYVYRGRRQTLRLPKVFGKKEAALVKSHIEVICDCDLYRVHLPTSTREWMSEQGPRITKHLAKRGMLGSREIHTVKGLYRYTMDQLRRKGRTDSTIANTELSWEPVVKKYGHLPVTGFTVDHAEAVVRHYQDSGLAETTWTKRVDIVAGAFARAARKGWRVGDPFEGTYRRVNRNRSTEVYIPLDVVHDVVNECPDDVRVAILLTRLAGLRSPSEVQHLKREAIDLEKGTINILSPKTARYEGRGSRLAPLLMGSLELLEEYAPVEGFLFPDRLKQSKNIFATWWRLGCKRIGHPGYPRPFDNMRASWTRDLRSQGYSPVDVAHWAGHSLKVASEHYDLIDKERAVYAAAKYRAGKDEDVREDDFPSGQAAG